MDTVASLIQSRVESQENLLVFDLDRDLNELSLNKDDLLQAEGVLMLVSRSFYKRVVELLGAINTSIVDNNTLYIIVNDISITDAGALLKIYHDLTPQGFAFIDVLPYKAGVVFAFRKTQRLSEEERTVNFDYHGDVVHLSYSNDNEMLRLFPLLGKTFYEIGVLEEIAKLVSGGVIVDVGGNVGNHAVYFGKYCQSIVHSFEPDPEIFQVLKKNIQQNELSSTVNSYQMALGDGIGHGKMRIRNPLNRAASEFHADEAGEIMLETLDRILEPKLDRLDLLKVDVEGMEPSVLRGGETIIRHYKPHMILESVSDETTGLIEDVICPWGYKFEATYNKTPMLHYIYNH